MSTAEDNVLLQIDAQRTFADNLVTDAQSQLQMAMSVALGLGNQITASPPPFTLNPPAPHDPGAVPAFTGKSFVGTKLTAQTPIVRVAPDLDLSGQPFDRPTMPAYNAPALPQGTTADPTLIADFPGIDTDLDVPTVPDLIAEIQGIEKPILTDIVIPTMPTYQPPEFLGVQPADPGAPPTDLDTTLRTQFERISPIMRAALNDEFDAFLDREFPGYRSGMAALEDKLATYLAGGTALPTAIEDALAQRARDKINADTRRAKDGAFRAAAQAGHTLPSIALLAQARDADQAGRDNLARAAIDIAIDQAKREQENMQFAVKFSGDLRQMAITAGGQYYSSLVQVNGQALQYAQGVVDAVVKVYDLATRYSEVQARIYESEARIFEAKQRGAQAIIDAALGQVKALEAQANVDLAKVTAYRAFIEAVQVEATVYRGQVEMVQAQADLEKLKVELYQAKVNAFSAQVNADNARYQAYEATVRGESAKVEAAASQFRAYSTEVEAWQQIIRARQTAIESITSGNESATRVFAAQVEANRALNQSEAESIRASIESYDGTLKAYVAKENAQAEHDRALIEQYRVFLQGVVEQSKLYLQQIEESDRLAIARTTAVTNIAKDIAAQYSAVASSALSGLNSLLSVVANEE